MVHVALALIILLSACAVSDSDKGEEDVRVWPSKLGLWMEISGDPSRSSYVLGRDVVLDAETMAQVIQEGYLRIQPALAWSKPRAARLAMAGEAPSPALSDSGWIDPLLTHRIFIGRDGAVLISRDIAADSGFWAGAWSVIECESRFNAQAVGAAGERGLFQIHPIHQKRIAAMGLTWDQMLEIEPNVAVAESIWQERGWATWSCQPAYRADGHD